MIVFYKKLQQYDSIIVVGAQRSGTQIAAIIIAQETNKKAVHEGKYDVHNFDEMLKCIGNSVIHAPALSHRIKDMPDNVGVVFVARRYDEVIASQERVLWKYEGQEREKYKKVYDIPVTDPRPICKIKWDMFKEHHYNDSNAYYLFYDWLKGHPLFIDKQGREGFTTFQTE